MAAVTRTIQGRKGEGRMIAIKGMEMPKDCKNCQFACKHYEFGEYYSFCEFDKSAMYKLHERLRNLLPKEGKSSDCPLVEIVTCKDCKYNYENSCDFDGWGIDDDYFCAKGERKNNEYNRN